MQSIPPREALRRIQTQVPLRLPVSLFIEHATGHVLHKGHTASFDVPSFDQSAMDGWAVRTEDLPGDLTIQGELRAASHETLPSLKQGCAMRIFTGAPVPPGADAIVRQECAERLDSKISVSQKVRPGADIRYAGELLPSGTELATAGTLITPQLASVLASQGLASVQVRSAPKVWLRTGGDEIVAPGTARAPGQLYDSNHALLRGTLSQWGCQSIHHGKLLDEVSSLCQDLEMARSGDDVIVTAGGVSVGDYDCVRDAMRELGFSMVFERVYQRPGKPLCLAIHPSGALWMGLPGNPNAALMTARVYLREVLVSMGLLPPRTWILNGQDEVHPRALDRLMWADETGTTLSSVPRALEAIHASHVLWIEADGTRWLSSI